jgi:hypothetical protein
VVTIDDVLAIARPLPRSDEVIVWGRLKFRVGKTVYLAFSADETVMGFAFPKEWRAVLVEAEPHKFMLPSASDMRFNWVHARLAALDQAEMRDLVLDAWQMVVPKRVAAAYDVVERSSDRRIARNAGSALSSTVREKRRARGGRIVRGRAL